MHEGFRAHIDLLPAAFTRLLEMEPVDRQTVRSRLSPKEPVAGIYLFSELNRHLYVGRSNNLRKRILTHGQAGSRHNEAAFAVRIAREMTGKVVAAYSGDEVRAALAGNEDFKLAFREAKRRVSEMTVRFVAEPDPVRQCLLEVYVATALGTPYNDFDNH